MKSVTEIEVAINQVFDKPTLIELAYQARYVDGELILKHLNAPHQGDGLCWAQGAALTELVLNPIGVAHCVEYVHKCKECEIDSDEAIHLLQEIYDEEFSDYSNEMVRAAKSGDADSMENIYGNIMHYTLDY